MISSTPKWVGDLMEGFSSPAKIIGIHYLTPHIKKISFEGNPAQLNLKVGYANVIRVSETEFRNYTVAAHDPGRGTMEIIFHVHGNGVGSNYIHALKPGDELRISMARGQKQYDTAVKKQFLFGDETSLGIASSFLPYLKKNSHDFQFYFELDEENKNVPELLGFENCTVFPKNGSFKNEEWISRLPLFKTPYRKDANFILTGNVRSVQAFRKALKDYGVSGKIFAKGYWLEGKKGL